MGKVPDTRMACHRCPACGALEGVIRAAGTVQGRPREIQIRLECPDCHHSWHETEEHDDPLNYPAEPKHLSPYQASRLK